MRTWRDQLYHLSITSAFTITGLGIGTIGFSLQVLAQSNIVPDETLGDERSVVAPNFNGTPNEVITGGATRGRNLFHSFREFNVDAGRGAYFFSPDGIANILSRVTGENPSAINGLLGTFGIDGNGNFVGSNSNLFLINPNGIIFGPGSSLSIGGSFVATTADGIQFGEAGFYSATNPEAPSQLLTVDPSAFFFNQLNPGAIENQSMSGLSVPEGQSLLLLGGNVTLNSGSILAPGSRVELGAVAGTGTVGLVAVGNDLQLSFPVELARADVSLINGSSINLIGGGGGEVTIQARDVSLSAASTIASGINSGLGSATTRAGDIDIDATGAVILSDASIIGSAVAGVGDGGNITVSGQSISLVNGSGVAAVVAGQGNVGNVTIQAMDIISLSGRAINGNPSQILSTIGSVLGLSGVGDGGNVQLRARQISLADGAIVGTTNAFAQGAAGNISVQADDTISLTDGAVLATSTFGQGNAGGISVQAGNTISLTSGATFRTDTSGVGNAGDITVRSGNSIVFDGFSSNGFSSGIFSSVNAVTGLTNSREAGAITINTGSLTLSNGAVISGNVEAGAIGVGGDIEINADFMTLSNGGQVLSILRNADTTNGLPGGQGRSGNVTINLRGDFVATGAANNTFSSGIFTSAESGSIGNAGDLTIEARRLFVQNGAQLRSSTFGRGDAGDLTIQTVESVELDGASGVDTGLFTQVGGGGEGKVGDLTIETERLIVRNGAQANATIFGRGSGGNLTVHASDIELVGSSIGTNGEFPSALQTRIEPGGIGNAGNLIIDADRLVVRDGARIAADTVNLGNGGRLIVRASDSVAVIGASSTGYPSNLNTSVNSGATGNAGELTIETGRLLVRDGAQVSSSTFGRGNARNLTIRARESVEIDGGSATDTGLFTQVGRGGEGNAGDLTIETDQLVLRNGGQANATIFGRGNGGNLIVRASDIRLIGTTTASGLYGLQPSALQTRVEPEGIGDAGDLTIRADRLSIQDGARIAADTTNEGNAGRIILRVADSIFLSNSSILTTVDEGAIGQGGDINIRTGSLELNNRSQISSSTDGQGNTGEIFVLAREGIELDNRSRIASTVGSEAVGNSRNITLRTPRLLLNDRSQLSAATDGQGDAGNIFVEDAELVSLSSRSSVSTEVSEGAIGRGGNIDIQTNTLTVDDAQITASTEGQGRAGDLTVRAETINLNNRGQIIASTSANQRAGDITLTTTDLNLNNRARISARSTGTGQAGDIEINASGLIESIDSDIETIANNASGGNINVNTADSDPGRIILRGDSDITTNSLGDGGNITLRATSIVAFDDSDILARSDAARGGNIDLETDAFLGEGYQPGVDREGDLDGNGRVDVNADGELASGTITIPDTSFIQNSLTELPESAIDSDTLLANSCVVRSQTQNGTFTITGPGGLPQRPGDAPLPAYPTNSVRSVAEDDSTGDDRSWQMGDPIIEPQNLYQLEDGRVVLSRECP